MTSRLDDMEREELFALYIKLQECKNEIESLARRTENWHNAKAYWFASLSSAINDDEYPNMTSTMKSFLIAEGVMDENDKFIELPDEDEVCEEDVEPPTKRESSHPENL